MTKLGAIGLGLALLAGGCGDSTTTSAPTETDVTAPTTTAAPTTVGPPPLLEVLQAELRDETLADPSRQLVAAVPELRGLPDRAVQERVNTLLVGFVDATVSSFTDDVARHLEEVGPVDGPVSYLELFYATGSLTPDVLSISFHASTFFQGAANPSNEVSTFTIDLDSGAVLDLPDLFIGTEWAFALDFLIRDAIVSQIYAGDADQLAAWVEPDDVLVPAAYTLGPTSFDFWFPEFEIGPGVLGAPSVRVPYSSIGVYIDPDSLVGALATAARASCNALEGFDGAQRAVFEAGSTGQASALDDLDEAAAAVRTARPDLGSVMDVLTGWATAYIADPATELTGPEIDAIEASNDVLAFELELCP